MAATVTVVDTVQTTDGTRRRCKRVTITEASIRDTTKTALTNVFEIGKIIDYKTTLTGGTGSTVNPKIGLTSTFTASSQPHVWSSGTTAAHVHNITGIVYDTTGNTSRSLWIQSSPNNTATDHAVSTELVILEGAD